MTSSLVASHVFKASQAFQGKQCLRTVSHSTVWLCGHMSQAEQKGALRQSVKQDLRKLSIEIMTKENAKTVGVYLHCVKLKEVDTTPIVSAAVQAGMGKQCFVPLVEDRNANMKLLHLDSLEGLVAVPPFNILEPKPTYITGTPRQDALLMEKRLELLLMPGLAFDKEGHRLGRGGGYYDKFINKCKQRAESNGWKPPLLVALAFEAQMVPRVPTASHDIDVDILATAQNLYACSSRGKAAMAAASPA